MHAHGPVRADAHAVCTNCEPTHAQPGPLVDRPHASLYYANSEMVTAHARPDSPMMVSMTVQDLRVVFSSISKNDEHIQNPASFTWLSAVAPPQMARQMAARINTLEAVTAGIVAMMPDAIVIATIELPTDARTTAAIRKPTSTSGIWLRSSTGPMISPRPQSCSIQRITPPQAITSKIIPTGFSERSSRALSWVPL